MRQRSRRSNRFLLHLLAVPLAAAGTVGCTAPVEETGFEEPIGTVEQEVHNLCPDDASTLVEGIDVSYWQSTIDWAAVAADPDNIGFAIARVSHGAPSLGGTDDTQFPANWAGIRDQGLVRGVYQYWDPGVDPAAQANFLVEKVGMLGPGDLPAVVDVEETDGQSAATIIARLHTWVDIVEAGTGRRPMIYTGSYFWDDNVGTDEFANEGYLLWTAHYTTAECPLASSAWDRWAVHQYTSSGSVNGIGGNVDRNHFNGNWEALNDLAANGYRAEVVSLDYPATMAAGSTATATLVVRNLGARGWGADVKLGTTDPRDRESAFAAEAWESTSRVQVVAPDVASGAEHTFSFELRAPEVAGDYVEHFNLLREAVAWFSDTPPGGGPTDTTIALTIHVTESGTGGSGTGGGAAGGDPGGAGPGAGGAGPELDGVPAGSDDGDCECGVPGGPLSAPRGGWALGGLLALCTAARRRVRRATEAAR